jgi:CheY-like chemotaxis protein
VNFIQEIFSSQECSQNVEIEKTEKRWLIIFIKENKIPDMILTDINMPLLNGF